VCVLCVFERVVWEREGVGGLRCVCVCVCVCVSTYLDAVQVEDVGAAAKGDRQTVFVVGGRVGLWVWVCVCVCCVLYVCE
jgi:hypothetical protein